MSGFCVYTHHRPDGSIFYVGKGSLKRSRERSGRNERWTRTVQKYGSFEVRIVAWYDQEDEALDAERALIAERRLAGDRLVNMSDGGGGPSGYRLTHEHRAIVSRRHRGVPKSPEHRARISAALTNKAKSPEQVEKMRQLGGRPVLCVDTGHRFPSATAAAHWLESSGRRAAKTNIQACAAGRPHCRTAYGYRWMYLDRLTVETP